MIRTFEELSLNAWPALQTKLYDGWVLRFADGYTKRSNSINPLYDSTLPLEEKINTCESEYRARNLPAIFKLTSASVPQGLDAALAERGYGRLDETSVRVLAMRQYHYRRPEGILAESAFSDGWLADFYACSGMNDPQVQRTAQNLLKNILGKVVVVRKVVDGQTVGCGFGAIERGCIGIYDIMVDTGQRGCGYGRDIMDGILSAATDEKVETAYLSVIVGNAPAENLYRSIGFQEIYRYWYRKQA
jgi:GNAT superfamily N-acetyltransferase